MQQYFLNPTNLLLGAGLLSVPIIIHLINRMRYRRVKWAAMEFLLESQRRNRRRLRLEQLLLLLLRMAVVALVVLLVARPLVQPALGGFLGSGQTHHVVLLDDTVSTSDRFGAETAFERAKRVVMNLARAGAMQPGTQRLTLLRLSRPHEPEFVDEPLSDVFVSRLERRLSALESTDLAIDPVVGASAALERLREVRGQARVFHLVSDLRERDWREDGALGDVLGAMAELGVAVDLVRTADVRHDNLAVESLEASVERAAAGISLPITVRVRNYGRAAAEDVRLAVLADDELLPDERLPTIPPGETVTHDFQVRFSRPGPRRVEVRLPSDNLESDNARYLAVEVPETNRVLIVDGDPAGRDAHFVRLALAPGSATTGLEPQIEDVQFLRGGPAREGGEGGGEGGALEDFHAIFLLNVPELPRDAVERLEAYVAAGGGVAVFVGDLVNAAAYNDRLYRDGEGMLPVRLLAPAQLEVEQVDAGADLVLAAHPIFTIFEGDDNPFVDLVSVRRYYAVHPDWRPGPTARVIGRLRTDAPLVVERTFGEQGGTVLAVLTTAGTGWNDWAQNPSYVVTMLEMEPYLARAAARSRYGRASAEVGTPFEVAAPEAEYRAADGSAPVVAFLPPGQTRPERVQASQGVAVFGETSRRGFYTAERQRRDGAREVVVQAYNVNPAEGDLALAGDGQIAERLPGVAFRLQDASSFDMVADRPAGIELRDLLLVALGVFLLAETVLAYRLGYHVGE